MNGNNISTDSYDSADPNYSTNGLYTPLRRKANGDVVTGGLVLNVGNANVRGHVRTAPGGWVTWSNNVSVGDLNNDGRDDVIVTRQSGPATVNVFSYPASAFTLVRSFTAYTPAVNGGLAAP